MANRVGRWQRIVAALEAVAWTARQLARSAPAF